MSSKSKIPVKAPTLRWRIICAAGTFNLGLLVIFPNCASAPTKGPRGLDQEEDPPEFAPGPGMVVGNVVQGAIYAPVYVIAGAMWTVDRKKESSARKAFLKRKSYPEKEWNKSGLWEKIGSSPATYVPRGYSAVAKYGYDRGTWYVDPSDHKRLFVPLSLWGNHDSRFWASEAKKIAEHWWTPSGASPASPNNKQI